MLTLISSHRTWAHEVAAGWKLAGLCVATLLIVQATGLWLGLGLLAVLALVASGGVGFAGAWVRLLRPLWPFALIVVLWHLWLRAPATGVTILVRLVAAVGLANAVTMTTRLSDILDVLTRLARPLSRLGLSPRMLALSVALVIRFIPVMLARHDQIRDAWRMRSARRPGWRILVPVLLATLDDADRVAEALRARGGAG
ncbi:energy-coupling factor transporter transmembrane protein EcfT [bacterium]|nr:energy-coupling factor transporter transmembrane protein EcfT [bacterium]